LGKLLLQYSFQLYFSLYFISDTQLQIRRKHSIIIIDENKDSKHKIIQLFDDVL